MVSDNSKYRRNIALNGQRGIVLVTSLLILIMVTIIAASAFKTSYIQTLIAGNVQTQTVSFNKAERTLRLAENWIEQQILTPAIFNFGTTNDGYYNEGQVLDVWAIDWDNIVDVVSGADVDDKYVIQYFGRQPIPGTGQGAQSNGTSGANTFVHVFVITARSLTAKRGQRVVQSVYVTFQRP